MFQRAHQLLHDLLSLHWWEYEDEDVLYGAWRMRCRCGRQRLIPKVRPRG